MNTKILIAGFGGQGVLFTGKFLAYCGMLADKQVSWLPSYGPEMRGGTANCSVIIDDLAAIGSPIVDKPDVLVVMNSPSLDKFEPCVAPGGSVFTDSTLITRTVARTDIAEHRVPATALAEENELSGLSNMIMLGKVLRETKLFGGEHIEAAMKKTVSERKKNLFDANLRAIEIGQSVS